MKRLLTLLLCLALLSGCQTDPQVPSLPETQPVTESTAATEATLPREQPGVPLLDQGSATGESENLLYIPNPHVESMACPEISLYGNSLLLYEHTPEGMVLKRIFLADGCLLAEAVYELTPSTRLQIGNGCISLCDSGSGQVLILNDSLEQETCYSVPAEGENWCLDQDMENLFVFFPEEGLMSRNLVTGETKWILENAAFVRSHDMGSGYVLFSYTDREDQKTYNRCLNLSTATLETLPIDGVLSGGIRSGEQWLLRKDIASGEYILVNQDTANAFVRTEGLVQMLSGKRQLLITDGSYRNLYLYDLKGSFLSRCALTANDHASVGTNLVWSGYWQGYFFRDTYDNAAHLMFWDTTVPQEGENLTLVPVDDVQPPEPVMPQSLYKKAEELSQRYGLDIRIGEACELGYSHYDGDIMVDPYFVQEALNTLELAFSAYPEGFLNQLPFGNMTQIRIELVANLRSKEDVQTHPTVIVGFAQAMPDYYLVALDVFSLWEGTIYHEFSHIIDKRLEWDASLRPDALFDEAAWVALQPKGFRYAFSYTDIPDEILAFENSGYFVTSYALTFPTEDRATLMELVMSNGSALHGNPGMVEKMRYYAACIRDCFDTEGWPEMTVWEQVLRNS